MTMGPEDRASFASNTSPRKFQRIRKPGTQVGPYQITAPLGAGGMGEVFRAWDGVLEREVAVKVIRLEMDMDDSFRKRFQREARALAHLDHPYILKVLDYGEQERLLGEKCARKWQIPYSNRTRVSRGAMLSWIKQYKENGSKLESLYPKDREDRKKSRAIDAHTAENLIALRKSMPRATVPALIKIMEKRRRFSK